MDRPRAGLHDAIGRLDDVAAGLARMACEYCAAFELAGSWRAEAALRHHGARHETRP